MAEVHGSETRIYANGLDISTLFREADAGRDRELVDTTGFARTHTRHIAAPMGKGSIVASGMLEVDPVTGAREVKDMLDAAGDSTAGDSIVVWMGRDTVVGDPGFAVIGSIPAGRVKQPLQDVVQTSFQADANRSVWVQSLHPLAARTAAHNGDALDNAASSAYGGVALATVTELTGTAVLALKVQHSTDGATWVDLATFDAIDAAAVAARYRDAVVVSGTVNRFLRAQLTVTSGVLTSVTFAVQFGRYTTIR